MTADGWRGERGAVDLRWVFTILLICAVALGGGFLVGFLLGS